MARNEKTSRRVGKLAGEALADDTASAREKALAGSALSQAPDKKKPAKKKKKAKKAKKARSRR